MAETADSVAIELEGRFGQFKAASHDAANSFDSDVGRIIKGAGAAENAVTGASDKMYNAFGNAGARSRQLGIQIGQLGSSLGSGINPMVVLSQQASDFAYVLGGTGGVAGRVATFFSGPWGAALLAASLTAGVLISKLQEHNKTQEDVYQKLLKTKEQTALNEAADAQWARTIGGVVEANDKLVKSLRERLNFQRLTDQQQLAGQQARVNAAIGEETKAYESGDPKRIAEAAKLVSQETARLRDLTFVAARDTGAAMTDLNARATQWKETQTAIVETIIGYHPELQRYAGQLQGSVEDLGKATSAAAGAKVNFDGVTAESDKLNKQLLGGSITVDTYTKKMHQLAATLTATAEAAKKANSGSGGTGQLGSFIMPVQGQITSGFGARTPPTKGASSFHPAIDIAAPSGTNVGAAAAGTVITAGRLGGLGNVVIVDHGGGTITEYGHLSTILAKRGDAVTQGQTIGQVGSTGISTGPHLDYRMKIAGKYVDPRLHSTAPIDEVASAQKASEAAERQQREADAAAAREQQFNAELAGLEKQLLGATRDRLASSDQQFEWAQQDVEAERANAETAYRSALTGHRIDETQFALLKAKNDQLADAKLERLTTEHARQQADTSMQLNAQAEQFQIEDLQHEASMARTGNERREVALRLLTAEQALERIQLQRILDSTAAGTAEHELAQLRMNELDRARQRKTESINNDPNNLSPGQAYRQQLQQTAGQIDEAMDKITVDGLQGLNDELAKAIMGTESLGEVFDNVSNQIIAALVKIALQQLVIKPIADLLFGPGTFSGGGQAAGGGGGFLASVGTFLAGLFTPRASGGPVTAGGAYWVGENGPEPFIPTASGTIVPNQEVARLAAAGGGGAAPNISLVVNAPGATAETVAMIRRELMAAAPTLVAAAQRVTIGGMTRTRT